MYYLQLLNVVFAKPDCFFSPLYNLKSLKLIVGPFDQTIQSTINLLNCSPNLEALAIYFDWVISIPRIIAPVRRD